MATRRGQSAPGVNLGQVLRIVEPMRRLNSTITPRALAAGVLLFGLLGCEEDKPVPAANVAASVAPAPTPTPAPAPEPKPEASRPEKINVEVTAEHRSAVEAKYPEAKGFLVASEVEKKLQSNKALKDEKTARPAFDKVAKGKWILFSGNAVNLTAEGFDMGIVYTPLVPGDTIGISKQWFPVTVSEVEGYKEAAFKSGDIVVVLVKYVGAGKAGPGHELVATGVWKD